MIRRIDIWLGKRVFQPVIIWICQRAGVSQWRFHNYAWMLVSWLWLYVAGKKDMSAISLPLAIAFFFTFLAAKLPDREGESSLWFRAIFIVVEAIHVAAHIAGETFIIAGPNFDASCPTGILILAAEYARTIKTIPPRETKEPSRELVKVRS